MAERGKHFTAYSAAGSNATIKSGPGSLYSVQLSPGQGSTLVLVDADGTLGASPDLNSDTTTGLIGRIGPYSTSSNGNLPNPISLVFNGGLGFNAGLTLAITSNGRALLEYE